MLLESEIAEEYPVDGKEILTPGGWKRVKTAYKTVPLPVWALSTSTRSIRASGHHLVRSYRQAGDTDYRCHHICDLKPGDWVETEDGAELITEVRDTGETEEMYDITIDSEDGLFFSNGIVSHNSTSLAARQLILSHLIPGYKSLYVVPYHDQMKTYANRYQEMEQAFRGGVGPQDKYSKTYGIKTSVEMNYALTDADKIRGKTVDECICERVLVRKSFCDKSLDAFSELRYIRPGDQVVCLDGNNQPHLSYVKRYIPKGTRPCWTIQTESGYSVTCTANHRINTPAGWVYVADLIRNAAATASSRSFSLESTCKRDAVGNAPRGRQLDAECSQDESAIQSESGRESAGIYMGQSHATWQHDLQRRGKRTRKFRLRKAKRYSRHSAAGGAGSYIRIDIPGGQKESNTGLGRSINVGSRGVVVYGRWKRKRCVSELSHGKLFCGGTRYSDRMVSQAGYSGRPTINCTKTRRAAVQYFKRHGRKHLRYLVPYSSVHVASVCVQGGYTSYGLHAHMPDVWNAVCDRSSASHASVASRCLCVSDLHNEIYTTTCSRMGPEKMGNGYRRGERRAQKERKGVLRQQFRSQRAEKNCVRPMEGQEQGRAQRQTQVTESESACATYITDSDLLHLRANVRNEQSGVCCPEKPRDALLQTMPSAALQKYECKAVPKVIVWNAGKPVPDKITHITYEGELPVADLTVEGHHNFFAGDISVHNCVIDECQNMDPELIPEILYTTTTSEMATTIYAGTALSIDTLLESEWSKSSMGMWHVRAGDGKHWLNMYDKDILLAVCEHRDGPRCPFTSKKLNMTDGCFIHANQAALDMGQVGMHIPQCIIPDFANNPIQWYKIYKNIKTQDFKKVMQECFGIAVAEGAREITEKNLQDLCVITESQEELLRRARTGYYRTIISGCDWGGSDYNPAAKTKTSYTAHCIMGLAPDGFVDVLHWKKYSGMGYTEIAEDIVANHKYWNGKAIASDFGVGAVYNEEIRKRIPLDRHFIMTYTVPNSAPLTEPSGPHMRNQLALNRTEAISRVFKDIKSPHVKIIRFRPWDETAEYLKDFLSLYRAPVENNTGVTTFRYIRAATKPDDCLHAFAFAYALMYLYKGEPIVSDMALEQRIRQVLSMSDAQIASSYEQESFFNAQDLVISG